MTVLQQTRARVEAVKADLEQSRKALHQREADLLAGQRRNAPPSELSDLAHFAREAQARFVANRDALPAAERKLLSVLEQAWGLREEIAYQHGTVSTLEREVAQLTRALEQRRANAAAKIMAIESDLERLIGSEQIPDPPSLSPEQQQYAASAEVSRREVAAAFGGPQLAEPSKATQQFNARLERLGQALEKEGGGG